MAGRDNPRDTKVGSGNTGPWILIVIGCIWLAVNFSAWFGFNQAAKSNGGPTVGNPLAAGLEIATTDELVWSSTATVWTVLLLLLLISPFILWMVIRIRRRTSNGKGTRVDRATRHLASKRDIATMSPKARKEQHLAKNLPDAGWYGAYLGREVSTDRVVMSGTEDHTLNLIGARKGKTTSKAIPAVINAPGLCIATSCKHDLVDETIAARRAKGDVWIFDPQDIAPGITGGEFCFDPLDFVRADVDWDGGALRLTQMFENATTTKNAAGGGENAFFFDHARTLLTALFLAAALEHRPITDVYRWVSAPGDPEPLNILKGNQEYPVQYESLNSEYSLTQRTRDGVFAAAKNWISCLGLRSVARWVTYSSGRPKLDVDALAADDNATLYLLTKDTNPVPRPISSVLTVMLAEALEKRASYYERDRLPVPVVMMLDEIANVVRWSELPDLLSTYGSRGILLDLFLQVPAQGVEMWGKDGWDKLFALVSIRVIGPGQADRDFAQKVSDEVGATKIVQRSASYSESGAGSSEQVVKEEILPVEEIMNLPDFRLLVLSKGPRPMLLRMVKAEDQDYTEAAQELMNLAEASAPTTADVDMERSL